jgi:hypothetical protein
MMRRFQFEAEVYESLSCLPMAARRKLDTLGIKISLDQWQHLGRGERLMICHAPTTSTEESEALRLFINEATIAKAGSAPKELAAEVRQSARPPKAPPARLIENAKSVGVTFTQTEWDSLDDDQRYALIKLGVEKNSHNLKAAMNEFLGG